jgi:hypothetical protein
MSVGFIPTFRSGFKSRAAFSSIERLSGVLVVFELDHRLTLLEPFKIAHKGKFA